MKGKVTIFMYCKNCGTEMNEGTKFCPNCSSTANGNPATSQQNQTMPTKARLSHYGSVGVYEFLETLEPDLDFIWAKSGNDTMAMGLLGIFSAFTVKTYILAFNNKNLYFCQLSNLSGQDILNITKYDWNEITSFTVTNATVGKKLRFDTKHGKRTFRTQKIFNMENQEARIQKLLQLQKY